MLARPPDLHLQAHSLFIQTLGNRRDVADWLVYASKSATFIGISSICVE